MPPAVRCPLRLLPALLVLAAAAPALGEEFPLPPPGGEAWQSLALPRVERSTAYAPFERDETRGVRAESECSASALVLPLEGVDLGRTPRLRWRWRVLRGLELAEERTRSGDDFAARVYVMFPFDSEQASTWARVRHRLARSLFGARVPGAALNYVWTSREPAGARWDNPFAAESKMISLGPGPVAVWRDAEVDVRADYRSAFGNEPPAPFGLALMTDSDNSCGKAAAEFADFRLAGPEQPAGAGPGIGSRNLHPQRGIAVR